MNDIDRASKLFAIYERNVRLNIEQAKASQEIAAKQLANVKAAIENAKSHVELKQLRLEYKKARVEQFRKNAAHNDAQRALQTIERKQQAIRSYYAMWGKLSHSGWSKFWQAFSWLISETPGQVHNRLPMAELRMLRGRSLDQGDPGHEYIVRALEVLLEDAETQITGGDDD